MGYRWWQARNERPLFPFGHGLSYTQFDYEGLNQLDGDDLVASWTVRNTGRRRGREVTQLYLGYPDIAGEPPLQLRGFHDLGARPGQAERVSLRLTSSARRCWDKTGDRWTVHPGTYQVAVGAIQQPHPATRRSKPDHTRPPSRDTIESLTPTGNLNDRGDRGGVFYLRMTSRVVLDGRRSGRVEQAGASFPVAMSSRFIVCGGADPFTSLVKTRPLEVGRDR